MWSRCNSKALSEYLDGALSGRRAKALERHLARCSRCAEEIRAFTRVRDLLREWDPPPPESRFVERLDARLDGSERWPVLSWQRWAVRRLVPAAALVALSVGAAAYLSTRVIPGSEPLTVDAFLARSLDQDVLEIATLNESDLSRDRVLQLVLATNGH